MEHDLHLNVCVQWVRKCNSGSPSQMVWKSADLMKVISSWASYENNTPIPPQDVGKHYWCVGYDTWSTFSFMCETCMYVCMHAILGMGICVHMEVWAWSWEYFLTNFPPYSLRQVFCIKPRVWQYRQCHLWNHKAATMPMWHLHGVWGSEIQIPGFPPGIYSDSWGLNSIAVLFMWQVH